MPYDGIRYWGYRIDKSSKSAIQFFRDELEQGRLRQGWGYNEGQDLRKRPVDADVRRNLRMLNEVKQGHILLVPRLPSWGMVAIVEATDDWDEAYRFDIPKTEKDYGHIFPARRLKAFSRHNEHVSGGLRRTFRTPSRFWNIDYLKRDVQELLNTSSEDLMSDITSKERFENAIEDAFEEASDVFSTNAYEGLKREFSAAGWESPLVEVFRAIYPGCEVLRTAGKAEREHGTDILIRIPGPGRQHQAWHAIAVQVKDYEGQVSDADAACIMDQISKADSWEYHPDDPYENPVKLAEKVVLLTKAERAVNKKLVDVGLEQDVRFVFADDLKDILKVYARRRWGLTLTPD